MATHINEAVREAEVKETQSSALERLSEVVGEATGPENEEGAEAEQQENENEESEVVGEQEEGEGEGDDDDDDDDDVEGECGFCLFMKSGPCRESFVNWEICVESAEKSKEDIVSTCREATVALMKCMEEHPEYYEIVLKAEKEIVDAATQEDATVKEAIPASEDVVEKGQSDATVSVTVRDEPLGAAGSQDDLEYVAEHESLQIHRSEGMSEKTDQADEKNEGPVSEGDTENVESITSDSENVRSSIPVGENVELGTSDEILDEMANQEY